MKKVYTITFHLANNYGAMLQAYALQKHLQKKYDSKIVNYDNFAVSNTYRILKRGTLNPLRIVYHLLKRLPYLFIEIKRNIEFSDFRKKLVFTKYYTEKNEVLSFVDADTIVVGSDQVWNKNITKGIDKNYFLDSNKNINKISYAASCGTAKNIDDKRILELLNDFNSVSVREDSLKCILDERNIDNVEVVLDPTFLLDKNDWKELSIEEPLIKEEYIFAYSVSNGNDLYYDSLNKLSSDTGLPIIYFDRSKKIKNSKLLYEFGPEKFLNLLYNAKYVVTTSFHGVALSSIFNKKMFVVLSTYPDRIISILNLLNLNNHIINRIDDVDMILNFNENWNDINNVVSKYRQYSISWLDDAISKELK